jgi:hypothetical protein
VSSPRAWGDRANASIIVLVVVLSVVLNFAQTYRSQQAAERLREELAPKASVLRDGAWVEIARRDLVPGDIIRLAAGDRVLADARLMEAVFSTISSGPVPALAAIRAPFLRSCCSVSSRLASLVSRCSNGYARMSARGSCPSSS